MAKANLTHLGSAKALDKLSGYSGSIQGTPLDAALDEQRMAIWEARAIIDCVVGSLRRHFGDWPAALTEWPLALERASKVLDDATSALEAGPLEDRGLEIARKEKTEAVDAAGKHAEICPLVREVSNG